MRIALPCLLPAHGYAPRHAAPREPLAPSSRSALAVGLAAALLPLAAAPAAAHEQAAASGTPAASGQDGPPGPGALPVEPAASGAGAAAGHAAETVAAPAAAAAATTPASAAPVAAAAASARTAAARTSLTLDAPARDADGRVPVGVRLRADGAPVRNGFVRLERSTGGAWTYAGRLLTRADGTGSGTLALPGDSRLRATYAGAPTRTASTSTTSAVDVGALAGRSALRSGGAAGSALRSGEAVGSAVLAEAARHVGRPYRYGATGPSAFDCSGFTSYVFARLGKRLPHNSGAQERATTRVARAQARPGDLVFIKDVRGHVGIYAGGGRMYDAPRAGKSVSLRRIWTPNHVFGRVA